MTRPAPIMDRVLEIIAATPGLTVAQIAGRAGVTGDQVSNALFKLNRRYGKAFRENIPGARTGIWFHTSHQAERFREAYFVERPRRVSRPKSKPTEYAAAAPLPTPPNRFDRMSGTYTCPELYAPPSRPGAMDAYRLPSLGACDGGRP